MKESLKIVPKVWGREVWIVPYLAGFFDGEGTISIKSVQGKWVSLKLQMSNLNWDVVSLFKKVFGGYAFEGRNNGKAFYHWGITSHKASSCLSRLEPYLIIKKEQAQLAIQFQTLKRPRYKSVSLIEQIRSFNRH